MEIEFHRLGKLSPLRLTRNCSSSGVREAETDDDLRYTSLKDIIASTPTRHGSNQDGTFYDLDSSTIMIRNELVKRAASAYLQSAVILAGPNQNWFQEFWGKVENKAASYYGQWDVYVKNPLQACWRRVYRFLVCTLRGAWRRMIRMS